ncbi:E3 ubiquitin-protein ligase RGLG3-like isoform X2 [Lotus japonicus]|nr:E3 ubiquitin-protein ligase RGLG3-like isoform X2 [Lotus japonicus]
MLLLAFALAACEERDLRRRGWADYEGGRRLSDVDQIRHPPPPSQPRLAVPCSQPPVVPRPPPLPQPRLPVRCSQPPVVPRPPPLPQPLFSPVEDEPSNPNQLDKNTLPEDDPANQMVCTICLTNGKDLAFGCGHMSCRDCGSRLSNCHICRQRITARVMLFTG